MRSSVDPSDHTLSDITKHVRCGVFVAHIVLFRHFHRAESSGRMQHAYAPSCTLVAQQAKANQLCRPSVATDACCRPIPHWGDQWQTEDHRERSLWEKGAIGEMNGMRSRSELLSDILTSCSKSVEKEAKS